MIHHKKNKIHNPTNNLSKVYGLNLDRNEEILALYKRGLTLQQIGNKFGITRSRVQQITFWMLRKKILGELQNHDYSNLDKKIIKKLIREEIEKIRSKKRQSWLEKKLTEKALQGIIPEKFTSETKFAHAIGINLNIIRKLTPDVIQIIRNNKTMGLGGKRWSKFYLQCRMCGTTYIHHHSHGYCKRCYPKTNLFKEIQKTSRLKNQHKWLKNQKNYQTIYYDKKNFGGNREKVLKRDGYKCVICSISLNEHKRIFGSQLRVIHLNNKNDNNMSNLITVCRNCALKHIRNKLSKR
jgi:5-methylcytosine-specific restriction endonuclease McrA